MRFLRLTRPLRRAPLPERVSAVLERREGVLAAAESAERTWVVATRAALVLVPEPPGTASRLPWESVHRAEWDSESSVLTVERVEDYGSPVTRHPVELPTPGALLGVVRERVTASVVLQRRVELGRGRGFTVIARRPLGRSAGPGTDGLRWSFEFDPGVDPDDPAVAPVTEQALREAQESLGL